MITYTYEKSIEEITPEDQNFVLIFTDQIKIHLDSVVIPRNLDQTVDLVELNSLIDQLNQNVLNKFGSNF